MSRRTKYVTIKWTEDGVYQCANYPEHRVSAVFAGICERWEAGASIRENTVWIDDEENFLQHGIGTDEFPQHTEGYDE